MIIYDEPSELYHMSGCIGSSLIRAYLKSPRLFRDMKDNIADKETPALIYGTNMHTLFLEPDRWAMEVVQKPEKMSFATKEGKAWEAEQLADGKTIIPFKDFVHLNRMRERMPAEVAALFVGAQTEVTYRTTLDGLAVQCRFDIHGKDHTYDLKSIQCMDDWERAVWKYGYFIQARFYQMCEKAETGTHRPFSFIFAEKQPPYRWKIVDLSPDYDAIADKKIGDALHGINARLLSGCWDDPAPIREEAEPPEWLTNQHAWDQEESRHGAL